MIFFFFLLLGRESAEGKGDKWRRERICVAIGFILASSFHLFAVNFVSVAAQKKKSKLASSASTMAWD